jgi:glycosyltransferase involved in cell wall biosynthesis
MKKVSILLPVYNDEEFISKSVSSVLKSTYKNFELIIINDGSTDKSPEIINNFKDPRIKLYDKQNSGLIESLNYGLTKCNSEIIMRMDGDDEILENKIEIQLKSFLNSDSVLHGTGAKIIDNSSQVLQEISVNEDHKDIINNLRTLNTSMIHPSIMFYKDIILKSGGYDSKFEVAEDYELYYRISRIGKLTNIDLPLLMLRKNEHNISKKRSSTQTLNTLIARTAYSENQELLNVSKKAYGKIKLRVETSIKLKILIYLNSKITDHKQENGYNLLLKIFRKLIIFLIKN